MERPRREMVHRRWGVLLTILGAAFAAGRPVASAQEEAAAQTAPPPRPGYLIAEPTPNDNGTHLTVRWPRAAGRAEGFEYALYISRDPRWRWFECRRVDPKSGFVTDPDVAGYYPYRLSEGEEHFAIVEPTGPLPLELDGEQVQYADCIFWLAKERRYTEWVKNALESLRACEQRLVEIERLVATQRALSRKYKAAVPAWKAALRKERRAFVSEFGAPDQGEAFDVPALCEELEKRAEELEGKKNREQDEKEELALIRHKLGALQKARRLAGYLQAAQKKQSDTAGKILITRRDFLQQVGTFSLISALVRAETSLALAPVTGMAPEDLSARQVAPLVPALKERLRQAKAALSTDASAEAYDEYDRLRYLCRVAASYLVRAESGVSLEQIENDLIWNLAGAIEGAELPPGAGEPEGAEPPEPGTLRSTLARYNEALEELERDGRGTALESWKSAVKSFQDARGQWMRARVSGLRRRLEEGRFEGPQAPYYKMEITRLAPVAAGAEDRFKAIRRAYARRPFHFRLAVAEKGEPPGQPLGFVATASAEADLFDLSKLVNLLFAIVFGLAVIGTMVYVRRRPEVFLRKIAGLDAVDEAIGRATEMGKPVLFVHGLTGVSSISLIASLNILSRIARQVADYDTDLLVVNNDPIVYSVSYEVVQQGYMEAGRPDAFKGNNVFMVASRQFPYVAAVAGIMSRRMPAANLFMGYFYAESLILAEAGSLTGAIQIAATDAFTQLPFFITTCDYTLMGEELYAASAYLSRDPKLLGTVKAQDFGKSILLAAMPLGTVLACAGNNLLRVLFTAYEKIG